MSGCCLSIPTMSMVSDHDEDLDDFPCESVVLGKGAKVLISWRTLGEKTARCEPRKMEDHTVTPQRRTC